MKKEGPAQWSPGSVLGGVRAVARRTDLSIAELVSELQSAVLGADRSALLAVNGRLLGTMCAFFEPLLEVHSNRFSRQKQAQLLRVLRQHPLFDAGDLRGALVLDFGCGGLNPFSPMLPLIALGARRCIGVDLDPLQEEVAVRALARTAMQLIAAPPLLLGDFDMPVEQVRRNLEGLDVHGLLAGPEAGTVAAIGSFPIEYRNRRAEATELDDACVSMAASTSFLEHVPDPDAVVAEMARICRPGALGVHLIDGADHRVYVSPDLHPLEFLGDRSDERIVRGCNRVRPHEFREVFERHGFEVVGHQVNRRAEVSEARRASMVEPFRSMPLELLEIVGGSLYVRRR